MERKKDIKKNLASLNGMEVLYETLNDDSVLFAELADIIPAILYVFDLEKRRIVYVNNAVKELLGYDKTFLLGKGNDFFEELVLENDFSRRANQVAALIESAGAEKKEAILRLKAGDKNYYPFHLREHVFKRNKQGNAVLSIGIATKLPGLSAAQELKESKDLLQSVLDTNLVQVSVLEAVRNDGDTISDFRIMKVNKELEKETGRVNMVGKLYAELYPGMKKSGLFDLMLHVMETGQPGVIEYCYVHDGLAKWFSFMFVKKEDGLVATNVDITERKQAEQRQLKNLALLVQSEELAQTGSWEYDVTTKEFTCSDGMYNLFELKKGVKITASVYEQYAITEDKAIAKKIAYALEKDFQPLDEIIRIKPEGKIKTLKVTTTLFTNSNDQTEKILGVNMDISGITSVKETIVSAEEKIEELNRSLFSKNRMLTSLHAELTTFNDIAANDYKETLRKLYTIMEFIITSDSHKMSNEGKANIRRAQSAIQKMKLLTEDMISYSTIHAVESDKADVDLNEIVAAVLEELKKSNPAVNIKIDYTGLPSIQGYPLFLSLLFHHIIANAVKFRKDGNDADIHVQYTQVNGLHIDHADASPEIWYNLISITDKGIGFEKENAKKIFTMFVRVHDKTKYRGSGIGLAVCRKIMEMHDGFITAEGETDKGATFNCYFPVS